MFDDEDREFVVLINHEEQYSIWPTVKDIPDGWKSAGKTGLKAECLEFIEENWTDMRPKSLRESSQN